MAPPPDIRPRIVRLLKGQRRTDDVHRLFQWLRSRTRGKASAVRDIGDFIAHRDERDAGITWERGLDSFHMMTYFVHMVTGSRTVDELRDAALACFRVSGPGKAKEQFGVGANAVEKRLKSALNKINGFQGERGVVVDPSASAEERETLQYYVSRMISEPAITDETLMEQLGDLLLFEGALEKAETKAFEALSCFISVYAMTQMHGAVLLKGGNPYAQLAITISGDDIHVMAEKIIEGVNATTMFSIFVSDCRASEWAEPDVFTTPYGGASGPVEINSAGKLALVA